MYAWGSACGRYMPIRTEAGGRCHLYVRRSNSNVVNWMAECLWVRAEASKGDIAGNVFTEHVIRVRKWKKPSLGNLKKCLDQTLVLSDEGIRSSFSG